MTLQILAWLAMAAYALISWRNTPSTGEIGREPPPRPPTASLYRERILIPTSSLGSPRKALATGGFWRKPAGHRHVRSWQQNGHGIPAGWGRLLTQLGLWTASAHQPTPNLVASRTRMSINILAGISRASAAA